MAGNGEKSRPLKKYKQSTNNETHQYRPADLVDDDYAEDFDEDAAPRGDDDSRRGETKKRDFTKLELKPDHTNRPLWASADGRIFLETFSSLYKQAYDFLIAIAKPVCRPESMHEYNLTPHSLHVAVSVGLETETIITVLNKLSKTKLPNEMIDFIYASTSNYGQVKLVLKKNRDFQVVGDEMNLMRLHEVFLLDEKQFLAFWVVLEKILIAAWELDSCY